MDGDAPYTVDNNPLTNLDQDGQTGNNLTDSLLTQGDYDASYPASTTGMSLQNGLQDAGSSPSSGGGISGFLSQLFALPGKFLSGITNAIAITAGGHDARALLAGGGVDCWGDNYYGELGNATSSGPQTCYLTVCSTTPVAVIGFP